MRLGHCIWLDSKGSNLQFCVLKKVIKHLQISWSRLEYNGPNLSVDVVNDYYSRPL